MCEDHGQVGADSDDVWIAEWGPRFVYMLYGAAGDEPAAGRVAVDGGGVVEVRGAEASGGAGVCGLGAEGGASAVWVAGASGFFGADADGVSAEWAGDGGFGVEWGFVGSAGGPAGLVSGV